MAKFKVGDRVTGSAKMMSHWDTYLAPRYGHRTSFVITDVMEYYIDGKAGYRVDGLVWWTSDDLELIPPTAEAVSGAIRTVTRREIVPGVYGYLRWGGSYEGEVKLSIDDEHYTAKDLRGAASIMVELAEVLEENAALEMKEAA